MRLFPAASLLAVVFALAVVPAHADDVIDEDLKDCAGRMSPGSRIDACTDVIEDLDGKGHRAVLAYIFRGNAHMDDGEIDDAIADMTHAIEIEPQYAGGYMWRCVARARKNDRGAAQDCDRAVELKSDETSVWLTRAKVRARFGNEDGALSDYTRAIQLDPNNPAALTGRGIIYVRRSQAELALADLTRSLAIRPNDPRTLYDHGIALGLLHRESEAGPDFDRAIALDPSFEKAYLARALARNAGGNRDGARSDVEKALRINPKSRQAYQVRAIIRTSAGDETGAAADRTKAAELNAGNAGDDEPPISP